ncbi:AAA family ATPase [Clostridium botulinum C]|uniref:AAA family ATPase n=2 Tax=Clostridium botulinum TaxID=1491 RepID=A0A9Q4TQ97_CLOBO|nr:AAA family ATPase [Clostridium botulinum]MCD3194893.1 AAA family ATPase [Clostridium botulinum C]MCD3200172.1 AAA family ATPase [Clostridium botulinum C]MCD3205761.1 AAA family ATPase [Clostridium botulinum C]MCD3207404.1 AAA family ATPase [Clostridium botulinum C]MCD3226138.1 AAA family ATPase [Clostridium botulinum C]
MNDNQETGNLLVCSVKLKRVMYPKNGKYESGDWCIITASVEEVIEGEPHIHPVYNTITLLGNFPTYNSNEVYKVVAQEEYNERYKSFQYRVSYFGRPMNLKSEEDKKTFLKPILSDKQLNGFYNTFNDPFEVISKGQIQEMIKVKGVGEVIAQGILKRYCQCIDYSSIYVELDKYGLSKNMIKKLIGEYKSPQVVVDKIKENPYILADAINGIGWEKADKMALRGGLPADSPFRVKAFIVHVLEEEAQNGNSYVNPIDLTNELIYSLGYVDMNKLSDTIQKMYDDKILWRNNINNDLPTTKVGLMRYFNLENRIAQELKRINEGANNFKFDNYENIIKQVEKEQGWEYTDEQKYGIHEALKNQVILITGGGGTGKTSVVNGIIKILQEYKYSQCALSGKASSRMAEVTGEEGYTIHRLLGYNPDGEDSKFVYNKNNPLPSKIIIVDEISMIGGELFYYLIQAISTGSKLILLGDVHQLESIGSMNLAKDILESKCIATVELTKIHRQAQKSGIITESVKLREHPVPLYKSGWTGHVFRGELKDFELEVYSDKTMSMYNILESFKHYLPMATDITEIQILVPIKERGEACVFNINNAIQEIYNPYDSLHNEVTIQFAKNKKFIIRENDKIMVMKNNYKTTDVDGKKVPIFNGQQGIVKEIDLSKGLMYVDMPYVSDKLMIIPKSTWSSLQLGYASTVAKSQGSQYEYVIGCVDYSTPPAMLTKELVYTLMTRATKLCKLCGETRALYQAMSTSFVSTKSTFLKQLLDNEIDDI